MLKSPYCKPVSKKSTEFTCKPKTKRNLHINFTNSISTVSNNYKCTSNKLQQFWCNNNLPTPNWDFFQQLQPEPVNHSSTNWRIFKEYLQRISTKMVGNISTKSFFFYSCPRANMRYAKPVQSCHVSRVKHQKQRRSDSQTCHHMCMCQMPEIKTIQMSKSTVRRNAIKTNEDWNKRNKKQI